MTKNAFSKLILIFAAALIIRLAFVFMMPPEMKVLRSDDYRYDQIAMSMLNGEGFAKDGEPIAWRGPGYPFFLAGVYSVFGHNTDAVRIIQCALFALMCVLIYFIGKSVFNETAGLAASIISIFYGPFIAYSYWSGPVYPWSENLFIFLVTLTMFLALRYKDDRRLVNLVLLGIVSALTALTKPAFLAFMPFMFIWFIFLNRSLWKAIRQYAVVVLFFLLCVAPWTIRNYVVFHEIIPISNESGDIFLEGNHPLAKGGNVWVGGEMDSDKELLKKYTTTQIKNMKYKMGIKYLLDDPKRIPGLFAKKLLVTWNFFGENNKYNFAYGLILTFAFVGIGFGIFKKQYYDGSALLVLAFLWVSFITMIFFGLPRYRFPVEPLLVVIAGFGLIRLLSIKNRLAGILIALILIGLNLALNAYSPQALNFIKGII